MALSSDETPIPQTSANESSQSGKEIPGISPELQAVLQHIVDDVVEGLRCVGAMVATLERDNTLPVRAYVFNPEIVSRDFIETWQKRLGIKLIGHRAAADLNDREFDENLCVRAVRGDGKPILSNRLYDLFRPRVGKIPSRTIQELVGVKQVVAVPFLLEGEVVGNLFAATRGEQFSEREIDFLIAFGHQAATAIQSQRRLEEARALESVIFDLQNSLTDENRAFKIITDAVVERLGYVAAVVAPRVGNTLPVRAYTVDSNVIKRDFVDKWQRISGFELLGERSVAYLDREAYAEQLSVQAVKSGQIQSSGSLYDLVRPVIPKWPADLVQAALGVKRVIAVPFFLEDEAIGNLYVVSKRSEFSEREKELLKAFGQQAAIALHNARLYRKAEERRQIAEIFGKMAFGASASVHALRNHIGAVRPYLQLMQLMPPERLPEMLESSPEILTRLDKAADILDSLHEPWREAPNVPTNVNSCLVRAVGKVLPDRTGTEAGEGIVVHESLSEGLPSIKTSFDMLIEAFRVLIKNAVEAIREKGESGDLWIESRLEENSVVGVLIRDNGIGIKPEHLNKIFEMRWSTKEAGMGFGLFWTKDYVEGLGGNIKVESVWQKGTTFRVCLPSSIEKTDVS